MGLVPPARFSNIVSVTGVLSLKSATVGTTGCSVGTTSGENVALPPTTAERSCSSVIAA